MKSGYFLVSNELLNSDKWGLIAEKLYVDFLEIRRIPSSANCTELHGICDKFEDLPEGQTKCYVATFKGENLEDIFPA
jgi:hypothetical protein